MVLTVLSNAVIGGQSQVLEITATTYIWQTRLVVILVRSFESTSGAALNLDLVICGAKH